MPCETSSPDEHQCCYHWHSEEHPNQCCACDADAPAEPEAPTAASADDLHKWVRCPNCGHPQHSMKCRVGGTLNFCGCLQLTPANQILRTCSLLGGCPDHPVAHFVPAEAEDSAMDCIHLEEGGCCSGPGYCAHGCRDAAGELSRGAQEMATGPEPDCWACKHPEHTAFNCSEQLDGDDCDCGANAPHPEAPKCSHEAWECYGLTRKCGNCGERLPDLEPLPEAPTPPRRPPYAVAYGLEDGTQYEIALPGDATVRLDDGLLIVHHTQSPVKGLIQARPMEGA